MKLLFIENQPDSIAQIKKMVQSEHSDIECVVKGFDEAKEWISQQYPDIVSLDLLSGELSGEVEVAGQPVYDWIWSERFCPIIVYSAQPDAIAEMPANHPFIRTIQKGAGSPQKFVAALNELLPHAEAIRETESWVRKEFAFALREVAPYAFAIFSDDSVQRHNTILRCGRRRLAALMDELSRHGDEECLASWEQYLCPPVSNDILLGDILNKKDSSVDDPNSFSVVLTPSCDLVASGGRKPKVKNVLAASCCSMKDALARVNMSLGQDTAGDPISLKDYRKQLKTTILTQGYYQRIIPFPLLKGRIPTMAADLRQLFLIPIENIGPSEADYIRVASIDSPFRELISWAYMQNACRLAMPDRDFESWCNEIIASCQN
jgi:CheY-like chemotaxis protein